jgi:hypothetical protein
LELVDLPVALRVVLLDVLELRRVFEGGVVPVEVAEPLVDVGIAAASLGVLVYVLGQFERKKTHISRILHLKCWT